MTMRSLTITPEAVRAHPGQPEVKTGWLETIANYVQQATAVGDTVTLTAKPRMMTPAQIAEATGMSRSTVSRRIASGELRAVKVGNRNRIPYSEFERFWRSVMGDVIELSRHEIETDLFGE